VVAPVHIVIAHERQLVADVDTAMRKVQAEKLPQKNSFIGLITGCSRTGDIEKLLVIGAHGPRRVVVLLEKS
jgi:L-lactate dehydrogenase complex protein LldG